MRTNKRHYHYRNNTIIKNIVKHAPNLYVGVRLRDLSFLFDDVVDPAEQNINRNRRQKHTSKTPQQQQQQQHLAPDHHAMRATQQLLIHVHHNVEDGGGLVGCGGNDVGVVRVGWQKVDGQEG